MVGARRAISRRGSLTWPPLKRPSYNGMVNLMASPYNADPTGVNDIMPALVAALNTDKPVFVPSGTFRQASGLVRNAAGQIRGAGKGETLFLQDGNFNNFNFSGSKSLSFTTSGDIPAGSGSITLSSTPTGLAPGDYINVRSGKSWSTLVPVDKYGEVVRILSIAGNVLTLYGIIEEAYFSVDTITVEKLNLLSGVELSGFTVVNPTPDAKANPWAGVYLSFLLDPLVEGYEAVGLDGPGIQPMTCVGGTLANLRMQDLTDNPASNRFGYGVNMGSSSRDMIVENLHGINTRHLFTTGGDLNGIPRHIQINGGNSLNNHASAFDTHPGGRYITFNHCEVSGIKDVNSSAFNVRCPDVTINNPIVKQNPGFGVLITEMRTGEKINTRINGGLFKDQFGPTSAQRTIRFDASGVMINGTEIENPGAIGIYTSPGFTGHRIRNVLIRGVPAGVPGIALDTITDEDIEDVVVEGGTYAVFITNAPSATAAPIMKNVRGIGNSAGICNYPHLQTEIKASVASVNFPSVADGAVDSSQVISVPGARIGDPITVSSGEPLAANSLLTGECRTNDNITLKLFNKTGGALDPAAATIKAVVFRI